MRPRKFACLAALTLSLGSAVALEFAPDFDLRLEADAAAARRGVLRSPTRAQELALSRLREKMPDLRMQWDGMSGAPRWISRDGGEPLAPGTGQPPAERARAFFAAHGQLLGLQLSGSDQLKLSAEVRGGGRFTYVHFIQRHLGLEVHGGGATATLDERGAIFSIATRLYAPLGAPPSLDPVLDPASTVAALARELLPQVVDTGSLISTSETRERLSRFSRGGFGREPTARLVLFPTRDRFRLAWRVEIAAPDGLGDYAVLVDAVSGETLWRRNATVRAQARRLDARQPRPETEEHSPADWTLATIPPSTPSSPAGWITAPGDVLVGNNVSAHMHHPNAAGPAEPSGVYDYRFNSLDGAATNAWWWSNRAHDRFYELGFDEPAGNMQHDNFGAAGAELDEVRVVAHAWGARDAAFYTVTGDGLISTLNLFWDSCDYCEDHDGYPENGGDRSTAFMRDIVYHEYTHGVSSRLVGGSNTIDCLFGVQSYALSEGWSDIFAASFEDHPRVGEHDYEGGGWLRDLRHDLDYGDLCAIDDEGCEPHADGMIWAGTLWDLRRSFIALDPAGGRSDFERLLVEGMKGLDCYPSMLVARNGLLTADASLFPGSPHEKMIWNAFATRGMGDAAKTNGENDTAPTTDYTVPLGMECVVPGTPTSITATPEGDNAVRVGYDAGGAPAVEIWRESLDNPFDRPTRVGVAAGASSFLDSSVEGGVSYRYHVVAITDAGVTCRSGASSTADAVATGSCGAVPIFDPALTVSPAGDCALLVSWQPASDGCPGSASEISYSVYRAPYPGLEPSESLLIGRTSATSFEDRPPEDGSTPFYLVLAQYGPASDEANHAERGSSQLLRWVGGVPRGSRTTVAAWDFETGPEGWTVDNSKDPTGGWVLAQPHGTRYAGTLFAPDAASSGSWAWVTGDAVSPSSAIAVDNNAEVWLTSPEWDGSAGGTILSFDYWNHSSGAWDSGIGIYASNGAVEVLIPFAPYLTVQTFDAPARAGWQHAELDLADYIDPSPTMSITFFTRPSPDNHGLFTEFGIDSVRVENGAACAASGLEYSSLTVDDSPTGWGNGDGLLDPGETARLTLELDNAGAATAVSPTAVLLDLPPGFTVLDDTAAFSDIPPGATGASTGPGFTLRADGAPECGGTLDLRFDVTDADGTRARIVTTLELGGSQAQTLLVDDFSTDKGWVAAGRGGVGFWERGAPVGTTDGPMMANPDHDSPADAGSSCYVTTNGPPGGAAADSDVDGSSELLLSPALDLRGFKRVELAFDLWYYDNSEGVDPTQDFATVSTRDDYYLDHGVQDQVASKYPSTPPSNDWTATIVPLEPTAPLGDVTRVGFSADDASADHIVEMGVDNVVITGYTPLCAAAPASLPPNGIGASLRLTRSAGLTLSWQAPGGDASHDPPSSYDVYRSTTPPGSGGFSRVQSTAETSVTRPGDPAPAFYLVVAVNSAGTSGDEPLP